ncbi:MAG TPA: carboxylesterase family protein [Myxococcota bacterium]|nr:carboxylesterase family protein [Myxococcota bacterium]
MSRLAPSFLSALLLGTLACSRSLVPPDPPHTADPTSLRQPPAGSVVGFVGRYGSHAWLGVPYAKPPAGERRWRAPEPLEPWSGTREALHFGPHCPQLASHFGGVSDVAPGTPTGDEDCLYLNVYAPRLAPTAVPTGGARLPVMVWIHGGGNTVGLGDFYDGGNLAASQDVVVVTLNYRLGPFGWFRHASLNGPDASPADRSGNYGTLDLVRALEWVRDNIAAFGGDPGDVTIFGESAGGHNVYSLLLSPYASGLFQRAIVESGGTWMTPTAQAENLTDDPVPGHRRSSGEAILALLVKDGSARDRADAKAKLAAMSPDAVARYLRGKTAFELFSVYATDREEQLIQMPLVFADGAVLPSDDPLAHFARSDGWNRVPVIIGTNRDENKLFLSVNPLYVKRWFGIVPRVKDPDLYLATADAMSTMWKATGADGPAAAMRKSSPDVYVYRFDWDEEPTLLGFDAAKFVGAGHGLEIPFVFGHWELGPEGDVLFGAASREGREALSAQMRSYWTQFARTGSPGRGRAGDLTEWTAWDPAPGGHKYAVLDTPAGGGVRMGSEPIDAAQVIAAIDADPRIRSPRDHCWVLHEALRFDEDAYAKAGGARCAGYPFDAFPWPRS